MSGGINEKIREALRNDEFTQIVKYTLIICDLVVTDFDIKKRKFVNNENQIRSIILEEYLDADDIREKYHMSDYRFRAESPENYDHDGNYIGRTDIRIELKHDFDKRDAYYIIECKRIDGTPDLNKKYVTEGIARFVTQKYSAYYGRNIMLGFVVKELEISKNTGGIEALQNSSSDTRMWGKFSMISSGRYHEEYMCVYQIDIGELQLQHIFVDFSRIMQM